MRTLSGVKPRRIFVQRGHIVSGMAEQHFRVDIALFFVCARAEGSNLVKRRSVLPLEARERSSLGEGL